MTVFKARESCLAVPADEGAAVIVRKVLKSNGWPEFSFKRVFQEESAAGIPGSWFEGSFDGVTRLAERVPVVETQRYWTQRQETSDASWRWCIPRQSLARALLGLVERLAALHPTGEVQGDLKPANLLLTADGIAPIDRLHLAAGTRSPALTRSWAAPEQVLHFPVHFSTDQYPLGLMLLHLVEGVLYGEEAKVSIPVGGRRVEFHTVLRNPGVYIRVVAQ